MPPNEMRGQYLKRQILNGLMFKHARQPNEIQNKFNVEMVNGGLLYSVRLTGGFCLKFQKSYIINLKFVH